MPWIILSISLAVLMGGVWLIVLTSRRYGFQQAGQNIFSRAGALLTAGVMFIMAGLIAGLFSIFILLAAADLRQTWNDELTKMFGRPPDRLELDDPYAGSLSGSKGLAWFGSDCYEIQCKGSKLIRRDGKDWREYDLTATPIPIPELRRE
ncbi:hypothetical protein [Tuwongella immobilis]|uniref:Uncharacterized protein n=1 Tax=Tuwongella immobilis TaxID=692036 RepID=A0A6C2YJF8_9BACT|nr:hypothetical protein [Tuwongella immobilis]VIP01102.1 unnamed protein product [Tuwongella immobilis]VTR97629.1 unnamed protein product [Tuwongella immobilis]